MRKTVLVTLFFAFAAVGTFAFPIINEVDIDPAGTDQPCEYIELRGTPGAVIENVYFVAFEGDAGSAIGNADFVISFISPGQVFGSNGLMVFTGTQPCGTRTYPAETTRISHTILDAQNGLENGAISFLLISSPTAITAGVDYDTNNDGFLELPAGAVVLDAVAWTAGDPGDVVYGNAVLTTRTGATPDAATRFPGNTTPNSAAAWYTGGLTTGLNSDVTYSSTVRSWNFPSNGVLTPGAANVGVAPLDAPVDANGDGKTDYVVVRAAGGPGSQYTWHTKINGGNPIAPQPWGVNGDILLSGDFDGDLRDDVTVYRPNNNTFYIVQSSTMTMRIEQLGAPGDDPTIIGDYNADGRDDVAVYRPGNPSTWFYKTAPNTYFVAVPWGAATDFVAPGDYDGDGFADFVVQRADGANARFHRKFANGNIDSVIFGGPDDAIVPGDYDGDGKTDLAVVRVNLDGFIEWDFEPSGTAGVTVVRDVWGVAATDLVTQGDYNGDGTTDYSVFRTTTGQFFNMTVGTRVIFGDTWGQQGDFPVARYNFH
jgi:hypothetical protein